VVVVQDANYCINILNMIPLYDRPIRVNKASQDKNKAEVTLRPLRPAARVSCAHTRALPGGGDLARAKSDGWVVGWMGGEQVGANLFIGNLDPDVDEKLLYDTFSAFGVVTTTPKIMRDPDTGSALLHTREGHHTGCDGERGACVTTQARRAASGS
jgi:splicing factor 3B subunit 4